MKKVTMIIFSLLMICGFTTMSFSFTDGSPPGLDAISINYQVPQTNPEVFEVQEQSIQSINIEVDITVYNSNLTNWPSINESLIYTRKLRGITLKSIMDIFYNNSLNYNVSTYSTLDNNTKQNTLLSKLDREVLVIYSIEIISYSITKDKQTI